MCRIKGSFTQASLTDGPGVSSPPAEVSLGWGALEHTVGRSGVGPLSLPLLLP